MAVLAAVIAPSCDNVITEVRKMKEKIDHEQLLANVEEFSRVQASMTWCEKKSESYKLMKRRYTELKKILQSCGVGLDQLDIIKE